MSFSGERSSHRRLTLLLAFASALGLLSFLALWIVPRPTKIEASQGTAQVLFQADHSLVALPGDCLTLSWEASGIQAIYLNGAGETGQGTSTLCLQANAIQRLQVDFEDGSRQVYQLQTGILIWQAEFWLLLGAALVSLLIAGRLTFGPLHRRPRLSAWIILLGATATLGLALAMALLHPRPTTIGLTAGTARINLTAEQDWVLRPTDCITLTWALYNIQAAYLNGEGIPGTGTDTYCLSKGQPDLRILLPDGSEVHAGLTIHIVLGLSGVVGLVIGAVLLGSLASWLGFAWAQKTFQALLRPLLAPEGRRQLANLGLLLWISASMFIYWIMAGAPGLAALRNLHVTLNRVLLQIFSAPYQG